MRVHVCVCCGGLCQVDRSRVRAWSVLMLVVAGVAHAASLLLTPEFFESPDVLDSVRLRVRPSVSQFNSVLDAHLPAFLHVVCAGLAVVALSSLTLTLRRGVHHVLAAQVAFGSLFPFALNSL